MKILNYVELIDSVRSNRTELYTKKHKNNQKIRKSSGTVRRDNWVRFENLLKFDSFTVAKFVLFYRGIKFTIINGNKLKPYQIFFT